MARLQSAQNQKEVKGKQRDRHVSENIVQAATQKSLCPLGLLTRVAVSWKPQEAGLVLLKNCLVTVPRLRNQLG